MDLLTAFRDRAALLLAEARIEVGTEANRRMAAAAPTGQLGNGRFPLTLVECSRQAGDGLLRKLLAQVDAIRSRQPLFESAARDIVLAALGEYYDDLQSTLGLERLRQMTTHAAVSASVVEAIRLQRDAALRRADHHAAGLPLDAEEGLSVSTNTVNLHNSQANVQQGGAGNVQVGEFSMNWGSITAAVSDLDSALSAADVAQELRAALEPDLQTIKAQLRKPSPTQLIVGEAAKSMRNIVEGMVGSAILMTPQVVDLVHNLARLAGAG